MIDLKTFEIRKREVTSSWSEAILYAKDPIEQKLVRVANLDICTNGDEKYSHCTEENALKNLEALKKYLIESGINTTTKWIETSTKKTDFVRCFHEERPIFDY